MRTRVTAIIVAKHGGEWLTQTLAGLGAQTRPADRIIGVINSGRDHVVKQFAEATPTARLVTTQHDVPFGVAVQQGITMLPAMEASGQLASDQSPAQAVTPSVATASSPQHHEPVQDWFWLLTEDSAPEPGALQEILSTVQRAPSVAIAGPKLIDWHHPDRIIELGQSLTTRGYRWLLRRQERDQQQYDHLQDVLGVGPVGMLVRADAWQRLGGFDPAYRVYDDGLDLSIRARLAGYRVVVSPTSRVRFARRGVAGPRIERSRHLLRVAHREARTSGLRQHLAYSSGFVSFLTWLVLPLIGVVRMAWALLREQPGHMWGELSSALRVYVHPGVIRASRRRVHIANTAGWGAVKPLRVDRKTVRTANMIDREAILAAQGRLRNDLHFISTGGLAVLIVAALVSLGLTWWAITQTSLTGGGLAPLSPLGDLWANTRTVGGVPADPFTWVLALIGTLTFWNPSHGVVLMLVASIPLAALGGWLWAAQLTPRTPGRVLLGLGWSLSPVLLGSLAAGRLSTLILAVVLPWLLLAATRCRDSWSWAGFTSLLAAIALACAPVLMPAAIVLLIVGLFTSHRGIGRLLSTAIAPLALFAPLVLSLLRGRTPLDLLLDPGIVLAFRPATTWQLLLGFPEFGLEGWGQIFTDLGIVGIPISALLGVLLLPLVLLAGLGLVTGRVTVTVLHAVLGGLGLLTAVLSSKLQLLSVGADAVTLWTGSGLALYWIALLGLAAMGADVLRRAAAPVVAVGLVLALVVVTPIGVRLATASTDIVSGEQQMPALVQAAGAQNPELRTLVLNPAGGDSVRAVVVTGSGVLLDDLRTGLREATVTPADEALAELVGQLASTGAEGALEASLEDERISFVLLETGTSTAERSGLQAALDQHAVLENAGQTSHGLLWRVAGSENLTQAESGAGTDAAAEDLAATNTAANGQGLLSPAINQWFTQAGAQVIWWVQIVVLIGMVLLALPTGAVVERPGRRTKDVGGLGAGVAQADSAATPDEPTAATPAATPEAAPDEPTAAALAEPPAAAPATTSATTPAVNPWAPPRSAASSTPPTPDTEHPPAQRGEQ